METTRQITLDINSELYTKLEAKQNDVNSRFIEFCLTDRGAVLDLTGHTVKIFAVKPDNHIAFNNVSVEDAPNGKVLVELTSQVLAVAGDLMCELCIYGSDSSLLSTKVFTINVLKSIRDDSAVESQNEFTALTEGITKLNTWDNQFQTKYDGLEQEYATELTGVKSDLAEKATIVSLDQTNANVSNINNQINNIVAHNGDGTKDSEILQARNGESTLSDRINNLDAAGANLVEMGMEEPGVPFYGTNVFNGWGMIMLLKASKISQIGVVRGSSDTVSSDIVVRLFETSSSSSIASATKIQEWIITASTWNALAVGVTTKLTLATPYITQSGKYYAVTIFGINVNTMQAGDKDGVIHTKYESYKQGLYCTDTTNTTYMVANYGAYCKIYQDVLFNKTLVLQGYQVPSHETDITSMKADVVVVKKTGYYDKNSEENGIGGYINSLDVASANGWGGIIQTKLPQITKIAVKKAANKTKNYTASTISVKLYETPDYNILTNATLIQAFSIPIYDWQNSNGSEVQLSLTTPYTTKSDKYYAVTIYAGETIDVQQVGANGSINIPTNSCYKFGIWTPSNDDKTNYGSAGGGSYGAYFKLYNGDSDLYLSIKGEQVVEHDFAIKDLQNKSTVMQNTINTTSKYSMPHELHYENPLMKTPNFTQHWLNRDKDMYVDLYGNSITAWQTSFTKPSAGVTRVPPVCDRMGLAGILWDIIQFGSPIYRRFDDGKNSLVGSWDSRWASGDSPFFVENGTFITCYSSSTDNHDSTEYDNNLTLPQLTSKVTQRICPVSEFCQYDYERHIPKRISNTANASITYVIPAGYSKFDFLYHSHQQGDDNITITVAEGNGKVNVNQIKRDFSSPVDANGFKFSTKETHTISEDGYDDGVLCRRLYFQKANINDTVTITITKSSDSTKYFMYWGVTYWGTATEPNACHLLVTGRGSYNPMGMYSKRFHDIGIWNIDLIIFEHTLINAANAWINNDTIYTDNFTNVYNYIKSFGIEMFSIMPHAHTTVLQNYPIRYRQYWNFAKSDSIKKGLPVIDVEKAIYKIWQYKYPNKEISYLSFVQSLMYDGYAHPNDNGFDIYRTLLEPIFDMI